MDDVGARSDTRTAFIPRPVPQVFAALSEPARVARWWGPEGFTNTIHDFEFRSGGLWRLTMHGPDGTDYPNESRFLNIVPDDLVEIEHQSGHHFVLTLRLQAEASGTRVHWQQTFDTEAHYRAIASFVQPANEQNLQRLTAEVLRSDLPL